LDEFPGVGQNWDEVGLETGAGSLAGFELAVEEESGIGELFRRETEGGAKEDLGSPAAGEGHEAQAFLEVDRAMSLASSSLRSRDLPMPPPKRYCL
jgi:hypothetical protein